MIKKEKILNDFKSSGIITTLLNKAFGKDKKMEISLHDSIERNQNSMYNILNKDPYLNDIVKYQKEKEKRKNKSKKFKNNLSYLIRNSIRHSTNSILQNDNKRLSKNKSLPNFISIITNKINEIQQNEKKEKEKENEKKRISKKFSFFGFSEKEENNDDKDKLKNIPWIIRLKKNNPIKQILITNKKEEESLPKNLKKKQGNILQQISMEKRKSIFLLPNKINNFSEIIQNQINKNDDSDFLYEKPKYKVTKLRSLVGKCNLEIKRAKSIDDFIGKNNEISKQKYNEMINKKNQILANYDKIVIEEVKKKNKYDLLEEQYYKDVLNRLKMKISDEYAFKNKKRFNKIVKNHAHNAYQMFLRDLQMINNENKKKQLIENDEISTIEFILDSTYKDKENLKSRINAKNKFYKKIKKEDENGNYYPLSDYIINEKSLNNYNIDEFINDKINSS